MERALEFRFKGKRCRGWHAVKWFHQVLYDVMKGGKNWWEFEKECLCKDRSFGDFCFIDQYKTETMLEEGKVVVWDDLVVLHQQAESEVVPHFKILFFIGSAFSPFNMLPFF